MFLEFSSVFVYVYRLRPITRDPAVNLFFNFVSFSFLRPARLLHEALPLAFLIEKCGGASSDGERSLLDVCVSRLGQRTQMAVGSAKEVRLSTKHTTYSSCNGSRSST